MSCYIKPSDGEPTDPHTTSSKCSNCSFKLDTYDWMTKMKYKDEENIPELVEVRFKNTRKGFYKNPNKLKLEVGDPVVVESPTGNDVGLISLVSDLVTLQMFKKEISEKSEAVLNIIRLAHKKDLDSWREARELEFETMVQGRKFAKEQRLNMKINDVEYQADRKKATFYYTADGRVDFRELIKVFAKTFKIKVEMRQIGIRQEAGRVGGIGDCGRELCCSTWLTDFTTVPTIAAKQQNLYLNPSKLSGQCGRLKCCLNYELDAYLEALEDFPEEDIIIKTKKGNAKIFKLDILKGIIWFIMIDEHNINPVPVKLDSVHKLIQMNKKKILTDELEKYAVPDFLAKKNSDLNIYE